jgi:adenosylcobinamide kinase / adenosylcobinamide-phosphate guanylyltransferase
MRELILGGARSGKSALALRRAEAFAQSGHAVTWLATAQALDAEMGERIARHRDERPAGWRTVEEPLRLAQALHGLSGANTCVIVDCLTLWLTNLMLAEDAGLLERETAALLAALPTLPGELILVANEVGLGIVPDNALARRFRDEAGRFNQAVAALCERVTFVAAGLPLQLK